MKYNESWLAKKSTTSLESLWARMDEELRDIFARLESDPLADDVLERKETREMVNATMSQLPPHYREALEAKYIDRQSVRDIATARRTSEKAVESLLTRSRQAFRESFLALARSLNTEFPLAAGDEVMNPNDRTSELPHEDSRVANQNIERLLTSAYAPEMPDQDFVRRVGSHILAEAQSGKPLDDEQSVQPAPSIKRRLLRWETVPWIIIAVLVILLVGLPVPTTPPSVPDFYLEGDIVWIDGKAYQASDLHSGTNETRPIFRPRAEPFSSARSAIRPAKYVGDQGLMPRVRPAIEERARVDVGTSITTGRGERTRVTLPDGSTLYANESTARDSRRQSVDLASTRASVFGCYAAG